MASLPEGDRFLPPKVKSARTMSTSKIVRKTLEEAQGLPRAEIDFSEKNLLHLDDVSIG